MIKTMHQNNLPETYNGINRDNPSGSEHDQNPLSTPDLYPNKEYSGQNISRKWMSKLMRFILLNAGDGIERGEIVARYYKVERRYKNFYTDPCMGLTEKKRFDSIYSSAQPAVSKALNRLENRGLIELIRHGKSVKIVKLTLEGKALAETLQASDEIDNRLSNSDENIENSDSYEK